MGLLSPEGIGQRRIRNCFPGKITEKWENIRTKEDQHIWSACTLLKDAGKIKNPGLQINKGPQAHPAPQHHRVL